MTLLNSAGVAIAVEATAVRSPGAAMAAHPRVIQLEAGALVVSQPASAPAFQVLTPDAIVTGREGLWAVVVDDGRTRAFAWRGDVTWRRRLEDAELRAEAVPSPDAARLERLRQALDPP